MKTNKIAIFASGEGTNAQNIINYFKGSNNIEVALVISNKTTANVLNRAKLANIPTLVITKTDFFESMNTLNQLKSFGINWIVLAGFLWKVPQTFIQEYPSKIINIHPALLPKYGGKGMYGMRVHEAVIAAKEIQSGISIHYVNEHYDEGAILSQHRCDIAENETPYTLAAKIHELEYVFFPKDIEQIIIGYQN